MSTLDELKTRAEQMRREGASMAEIARAVGRSVSTIHVWAAQGGWRIAEIEEISLSPSQGERMGGEAIQVRGCSTASADPLTSILSPKGERQNNAEPLCPLEAARALQQRAAWLGQAGQIRAAEAAARLAERILRTEAQLNRLDDTRSRSHPERHEEWPGGARAELARRFARFRTMHDAERARDPEWTPRSGASQAEKHVFALCHGERVGGDTVSRPSGQIPTSS
ncbi:helix-turn-helix domain-containing protein [Hyphobacterium sp.]|uniref:helix-turn-helix domain-containing protein n=1 Tax=Hyphobacterium sp. TaxID=2004662 RepID=UPI003B52A29B